MSEPIYIVLGSYDYDEDLGDQICGIYNTLADAKEAKSQAKYDSVWIETWSTGPQSAQIEKDFYIAGIHLKEMRRNRHYAHPWIEGAAVAERLPSTWEWSLGNMNHVMVDASEDLTHRDHTSSVAVWRGGFTEAEAQSRLADASQEIPE